MTERRAENEQEVLDVVRAVMRLLEVSMPENYVWALAFGPSDKFPTVASPISTDQLADYLKAAGYCVEAGEPEHVSTKHDA